MTKKDYIKFVGVWKKSIRFMGDAREKGYHYIDADSLYQSMCEVFREDNPRFDENTFIKAMDVDLEKLKKELEEDTI